MSVLAGRFPADRFASRARATPPSKSAADALVASLPPLTLVVGKGGVGKTTASAALALASSRMGAATLVLSTDPAQALGEVLAARIDTQPALVRGSDGLEARRIDAGAIREDFLERWRDVIRTILDRGTYLDDEDIAPLVDSALPGSDEIFAALELARLVRDDGRRDRLVVDTAPTGHTLRLLNLPRSFAALVRLLDAMQGKHRFMVRTLTRAYRPDSADRFIAEMRDLVDGLATALRDPQRCGTVLVTSTEPVVVAETERYAKSLESLGVAIAAVIVNNDEGAVALSVEAPVYQVPHLEPAPTGVDGLARWLAALHRAPARRTARRRAAKRGRSSPARSRADDPAGMLRPLTLVAGKGGVGKSTVAAALALMAARKGKTLVVSTDPAPSLADVFDVDIGDAPVQVRGVPALHAQQMDAGAAFERLRSDYRQRVDALFDNIVARGVDLSHDRSIARDLLALAPPGIDEIYALSLLGDAMTEQYSTIIVDPAPTGHFLRLLEMPALALEWTHRLMRLLLKYREVAALGDAAGELLSFARSLRAIDAALRDPERAGVVVVSMDEPVILTETRRLVAAVQDKGVALAGVVMNRTNRKSALPVVATSVHFHAPLADPPPVGTSELRKWSSRWAAATPDRQRD